jgi:two-component system, chemotaxis family, protein-glutamate methylesterase/glutaminase
MGSKGRNIIVVGTGAGGLEALDQLIGRLPTDLPASIFIVQHMDPHNSGEPLLRRLSRHQAFHPKLAEDKPGHIYIAPPDNHLLAQEKQAAGHQGRSRESKPAGH